LTVDFYDNPAEPVVVEVEHEDPDTRAELLTLAQAVSGGLVDRSNDVNLTNEVIAHKLSGAEHLEPAESLSAFTNKVLSEMLAHYSLGKNQVVVGLTGMSGSGKTTIAKALQTQITELFGERYTPIVLSTDDYHYGKTYLETTYGAPYQDWDSDKTYNTNELAADLARHAEGTPLIKRHFDFDTEEPAFDAELPLSPFIIVEGLYAGSKDLEPVRDIHFEIPTSPATRIGRDIRRLLIDNRANRAFPNAPSRLRYQIESALPLYQSLEQPRRKAFSASSRPMAQRAFMLAKVGVGE
jgi:uridine kinase